MKNFRIRTRVVAALVAVALLLAMQVVPAGAAEPKAAAAAAPVAAAPRGASTSVGAPSAERLKLTEQFRELDLPRPERAEVSALAADDGIPGVPIESVSELPWPVVLEDLDSVTDQWDVYRVTAYPGEQISFFADPDPLGEGSTLEVDVYLWDASATSVADPPLAHMEGLAPGATPWICYTVPYGAASTTYYVGAYAVAGDNIVDYQWGVTSRSDGNIPGVTIPHAGFTDEVRSDGDMDDVFAVHLGEGETLTFEATVDSGNPISVYIYPPGETDIWEYGYLDPPAQDENSLNPVVTYTAGAGEAGIYYVDVYAASRGEASYYAEWEVTGVNIPGRPLPVSGTPIDLLPGENVGYLDLRVGETLSLSVPDPTNQLQLWLLGPAAVDATVDTPVIGDASSATTKAFTYTVPAGRAGRYYVNVEADIGMLDRAVTWSTRTNPARLAGAGRYETAVLASKRDFPGGANTVVIASGEGFADALSAAGLAGAYDAPILLVPKSSVPAAVSAEIVRLGATRCLIVGGTAVVADGVKNAIDAIPGMTTPRRIAGPNRYETSALVCDAIFTKDGWVEWRGIAAMARGDAFADALALAPISWADRMPILLTNTNYLPAPIDARLPGGPVDLPIFVVVFAGGTSAISKAVYTYVDVDIDLDCMRFAGANRYETAALIADWSAGSPWLSYEAVGLATGANFPDALGGGAAMAKAGGVLLMTEPTRFTSVTQTKLVAHKAQTAEVQVFGGTGAVNATVFNQVKALY